jgi:signal transduction histidine kinase
MLVPFNGGRERATPATYDAPEALWALAQASSPGLHRPIDAIIAHTGALLSDWSGALPAEARRLVFAIGARALDLDHMLEGLGRITAASQLPTRRERFPLGEAVDEAWARLASLRRGREVELELGALPIVSGDRLLLGQALVALLENALKFTRARYAAQIAVSCVRGPEELICSVRDNGVGLDAAQAKRLFVPFARLREHEALEGHGLGLALVDCVLKRHGGRAWASGKRGTGAEFFFSLPSE